MGWNIITTNISICKNDKNTVFLPIDQKATSKSLRKSANLPLEFSEIIIDRAFIMLH